MMSRILVVLLFLVGCTTAAGPVIQTTGNYKISVVSDGQAVTDFDEQLVHRIAIAEKEIEPLEQAWTDSSNIEFIPERDIAQQSIGIRVVAYHEETAAKLAILQGDLVTAVDRTLVHKESDFLSIFKILKQQKQATLTIQRGGKAHKVIYAVMSSNSES